MTQFSKKGGGQFFSEIAPQNPPLKKITQPLQICIGPAIRIGRESWCLPYAEFLPFERRLEYLKDYFKRALPKYI